MKSKLMFYPIALIGALLLSGCASSGLFFSMNNTAVELSENNYEIVATNIAGEAEAGYLLGLSFSAGAATNTLALARVSGSGMLYKEALENLWKNYEEKHGSVVGKKLALVNVRYDSDALNLILYTSAKISIRADVVEFK
jgi:hypothetical protein